MKLFRSAALKMSQRLPQEGREPSRSLDIVFGTAGTKVSWRGSACGGRARNLYLTFSM